MATESGGITSRPSADPDNRARTYLANERTFLAWLRTGLSLVAVGMAAARFLPVDLVPGFRYVTIFATLLVVAGIAMVAYGGYRYIFTNREIATGSFAPSVTPVVIIAAIVAALGVMAIPLVLLLR